MADAVKTNNSAAYAEACAAYRAAWQAWRPIRQAYLDGIVNYGLYQDARVKYVAASKAYELAIQAEAERRL